MINKLPCEIIKIITDYLNYTDINNLYQFFPYNYFVKSVDYSDDLNHDLHYYAINVYHTYNKHTLDRLNYNILNLYKFKITKPINLLYNIQILEISFINNKIIFPETLVELYFHTEYKFDLDNLPQSLKILDMNSIAYNNNIILPDSLLIFRMSYNFNKYIKLPNNLIELHMGSDFNIDIIFPKSLQILNCGLFYNHQIPDCILNSLKKLYINYYYNYNLVLNKNFIMEYLDITNKYSNLLILPPNLKHLSLLYDYSIKMNIILPEKLINLFIYSDCFSSNIIIPKSLVNLHIYSKNISPLSINHKINISILKENSYFNNIIAPFNSILNFI